MKKHLFLIMNLCIGLPLMLQAAEQEANLEREDCLICINDTHEGALLGVRCCRKTFHRDCLQQWFTASGSRSCPHCRQIQPQPLVLQAPVNHHAHAAQQPQAPVQPLILNQLTREQLSQGRRHWLN